MTKDVHVHIHLDDRGDVARISSAPLDLPQEKARAPQGDASFGNGLGSALLELANVGRMAIRKSQGGENLTAKERNRIRRAIKAVKAVVPPGTLSNDPQFDMDDGDGQY